MLARRLPRLRLGDWVPTSGLQESDWAAFAQAIGASVVVAPASIGENGQAIHPGNSRIHIAPASSGGVRNAVSHIESSRGDSTDTTTDTPDPDDVCSICQGGPDRTAWIRPECGHGAHFR